MNTANLLSSGKRSLGVLAVAAALGLAAAGPASAQFVDPAAYGLRVLHQDSTSTLDGFQLMVTEANTTARSVPPLDGNPLSREAFLSSVAIGQIDGPAGATVAGATLDVGFEIGVPWSLQNIAVDVYTPSVSVNGGVSAGVSVPLTIGPSGPSIGISPQVGANLGATATILPAQELVFSVTPGGIEEKSIANLTLTNPLVYLDLSNVHVSVKGALGQVNLRMYVRLTAATKAGQATRVIYSDPVTL
ncbi:MspA family porin [Nocardia sp. CDC159]|uniref:MspA family porin n=1 Tax=Nocardia pulmonis TaxID=2951408 RepID=A0A9X2E160_9NOCA|nr:MULTISPECIES: MspA family porin [Nocardia]MCM6772287.1 MspA family porin [Nocardia pulmonis]MCM6785055.1 MspA family porin [Nocardia sp. CDC159]